MQNIGEKIADLRKDAKMTQEELANLIGVSAQTISKWENSVTAPDIMLLPILAGIFEVTIDELFSLRSKPVRTAAPVEETPLAVYDAVLETMWAWSTSGGGTERTKQSLAGDPTLHTGFISAARGSVYADKDIALTYIADGAASQELLSNEDAAAFLRALADPNVRRLLKYQLDNRGVSYTVSSASTKCGMSEEDVKNSLASMVRFSLTSKQTVDFGSGEKIDIYGHCGNHKLMLLIYPILSLAAQLTDFKENWYGFRG